MFVIRNIITENGVHLFNTLNILRIPLLVSQKHNYNSFIINTFVQTYFNNTSILVWYTRLSLTAL